MEQYKFCVVYTFKSASTDYYKQTHQSFFESEETMVSFLEEIDLNPNKYSLKNVYLSSYLRISDKSVQAYKNAYRDIEEQRERVKQAKIKAANAKMRDALTDDDIDILKEAGVIK